MANRIMASCTLACLVTSVHAVPYTLPTSSERPHAKLSRGGATLCATWIDEGACDVPVGTYTLHRFDSGWGDQSAAVTIGDEPVQSDSGVTFRTASAMCMFDTLDDVAQYSSTYIYGFPLPCKVTCPTGVAIGGSGLGIYSFINGRYETHGFDVLLDGSPTATIVAVDPPVSIDSYEAEAGTFEPNPYGTYDVSFEIVATAICAS